MMDFYMNNFQKFCFGTVMVLVMTASAQAATYKWTDKDGNVHYSQKPPAEANYEKLNIKTPPPSSSPTPAPAASGTTATGGSGDQESSSIIKKEMAKSQEQREKNCAQAKKNLELYMVYRRVREKDGTVRYLTDEERAKGVNESKAAIKEFCE
jgi:hypothetical protein